MKVVAKLIAGLSFLILAACTGGGGGTGGGGNSGGGCGSQCGGGGPVWTHAKIAEEFVRRMNIDGGYDLDLVKTYTLEDGYIVVYDHDIGSYDAYFVGDFNPGEDIFGYLDYFDSDFFYDLIPIGYNEYEDPITGIIFEKTKPSDKDRLKMAALEEALTIKKGAETLNAQFGLSQERSFEVAKLAVIWQKTPKERMTDADHDRFAKDVLGHSISEFKSAVQKKLSGNDKDLKALVADTATMNGVSPEQMNSIIGGVFGVELK